MADTNKLERFRRLPVYDDWPECFLCKENSDTGFTLYPVDSDSITVCDGCLAKARSNRLGWLDEVTVKD